jgi:hypothetical protein
VTVALAVPRDGHVEEWAATLELLVNDVGLSLPIAETETFDDDVVVSRMSV